MKKFGLLALLLLLSACSGNYGGADSSGSANVGNASNNSGNPSNPSNNNNNTGGGSTTVTPRDHFAANVEPNMGFCRSCHVPGGLADKPDGNLFMLSSDTSKDYDNVFTSWTALGKGVTSNKILTKPSDPAQSHSAGQPWAVGSAPYVAMKTLLSCWDNPASCAGTLGGGSVTTPVPELPPLLGSKHARHLWASYCDSKDDNAVLPPDPRSFVKAGFNAGKAVYYNAYWQDCHVNLPAKEKQPKTCGEYRTRRDRGLHFLEDELPASPISVDTFNNSWSKWGLSARPDNFDQMYTLRYGLNNAPFRNPYPKPGEDPNLTNGGSGQLPLGLRQMKDATGKWTSTIGGAACFQCHGGQIGEPSAIGMENLGLGNNNFDVPMSAQDNSYLSSTPVSTLLPGLDVNSLFNIGIKQRGQNNAVGAFELLITLLDLDSLGFNPNPLKTMVEATGPQDVAHPLAHTQDTPAWWNMGSRPRKFFDAGISNDGTRIIMAAGPGELNNLITMDGKLYRDRIELYDQDLEAFFLSLRSPDYPGTVDLELAKTGAILFHSKNLWAADQTGNAKRPKPLGGNGSCASCHGAYSPRYVNDKNYLVDPVMEGVAGHISPLDVIGTDRARSDMLTPTLRQRWDTTYWAYTDGVPGFVAPGVKDPVTELADDMLPVAQRPHGVCGWEKEVIGYQAPPLYGVWATAPYFHNGSVPTVEAVLDSSKRSPIWQRKLQTSGPVTGFDQRMSAYDFNALGWQSTVLSCSQMPGNTLNNCNPANDQGPSLTQLVQNLLNSSVSWTGLVNIPDPSPGAIDKRLIYDTRTLGNGNGGHEFTDVLTQQERKAILEYLKTL
jgi:hypothetical protein